MIALRELLYGVYGGYRLCRFDIQGLASFTATHAGFWRSFFSAVLVAPAFLLQVLMDHDLAKVPASGPRILLLESVAYLVLVFAYPLAMHYVAEAIQRQQQYFLYIVAYNWAAVTLAAIQLPVDAVAASGLLPAEVSEPLELAMQLLVFAILWFIAKSALNVPRLVAVGLVALDFLITLAVTSIVNARLGIE